MNLATHPDLLTIRASLVEGLQSYLDGGHADYDAQAITQCEQVLDNHVAALQGAKTRDEALAVVEKTVRRLNALNEEYNSDLIETDQREQLAEFIIKAGALLGFNGNNEDVTEQWREW